MDGGLIDVFKRKGVKMSTSFLVDIIILYSIQNLIRCLLVNLPNIGGEFEFNLLFKLHNSTIYLPYSISMSL